VLALVIVGEYLVALHAHWPADEARALAFATLLASQVVLLLSMRSPDRPFWASGRPWSRTLSVVVAIVSLVTVAAVYLPPLADLLHLAPFPAGGWAFVVLAAATTAWSEPLKRPPA
jgi:magnesium-transporting ATPase (P-type)